MIVDMHAHYTPLGFLESASKGKGWHGWTLLRDACGREYLTFGDRVFPFARGSEIRDPGERIKARNADQGVEFEVLQIFPYLWNYHLQPERGAAFCREVNNELSAIERSAPEHFRGLAILPMQSTDAAIRELERVVGDLGMRSVVIASNVNGKNLDDPTILPVLEAAAEANVLVFIHPPALGRAGEDRFSRNQFANSFGIPLEAGLAAMSIIYSGLLDRRDLKAVFSHGGGWVHYGIGRFSLFYHQRADACPMQLPPEAYLSRMYYDCLVHDSETLKLLVRRVGADRVVHGTDFPGSGDIPGGAAKWVSSRTFLSDHEKRQILDGNARRLLALPGQGEG